MLKLVGIHHFVQSGSTCSSLGEICFVIGYLYISNKFIWINMTGPDLPFCPHDLPGAVPSKLCAWELFI